MTEQWPRVICIWNVESDLFLALLENGKYWFVHPSNTPHVILRGLEWDLKVQSYAPWYDDFVTGKIKSIKTICYLDEKCVVPLCGMEK